MQRSFEILLKNQHQIAIYILSNIVKNKETGTAEKYDKKGLSKY